MLELHEITSEADFNGHTTSLPSSALLVLSFHTPWAAPCAQMRSVLATLASSYPATTPPQISFVSVNAEDLPEISEQYDVTAVPFVVLQRGGNVLQSISGSDPVKVREAIEKHGGSASGSTAQKQTIPPVLDATARENNAASSAASGAETGGGPVNGNSVAPSEAAQPTKEELFARLGELVQAAPVMLFMKGTPSSPQCGFSRQLVGLLRENGVKYGFFNILADEDVRQGLKEYADWPTFPQLWVKGELVGGLDIVKEELSADAEFLSDYAVPRAAGAAA